jgi:hypothetical protein
MKPEKMKKEKRYLDLKEGRMKESRVQVMRFSRLDALFRKGGRS